MTKDIKIKNLNSLLAEATADTELEKLVEETEVKEVTPTGADVEAEATEVGTDVKATEEITDKTHDTPAKELVGKATDEEIETGAEEIGIDVKPVVTEDVVLPEGTLEKKPTEESAKATDEEIETGAEELGIDVKPVENTDEEKEKTPENKKYETVTEDVVLPEGTLEKKPTEEIACVTDEVHKTGAEELGIDVKPVENTDEEKEKTPENKKYETISEDVVLPEGTLEKKPTEEMAHVTDEEIKTGAVELETDVKPTEEITDKTHDTPAKELVGKATDEEAETGAEEIGLDVKPVVTEDVVLPEGTLEKKPTEEMAHVTDEEIETGAEELGIDVKPVENTDEEKEKTPENKKYEDLNKKLDEAIDEMNLNFVQAHINLDEEVYMPLFESDLEEILEENNYEVSEENIEILKEGLENGEYSVENSIYVSNNDLNKFLIENNYEVSEENIEILKEEFLKVSDMSNDELNLFEEINTELHQNSSLEESFGDEYSVLIENYEYSLLEAGLIRTALSNIAAKHYINKQRRADSAINRQNNGIFARMKANRAARHNARVTAKTEANQAKEELKKYRGTAEYAKKSAEYHDQHGLLSRIKKGHEAAVANNTKMKTAFDNKKTEIDNHARDEINKVNGVSSKSNENVEKPEAQPEKSKDSTTVAKENSGNPVQNESYNIFTGTDYKSLKEAISLGSEYFENEENRKILEEHMSIVLASENDDLLYEEYNRLMSEATAIKEKIVKKYSIISHNRSNNLVESMEIAEAKIAENKNAMFKKLNEQQEINSAKAGAKKLTVDETAFN